MFRKIIIILLGILLILLIYGPLISKGEKDNAVKVREKATIVAVVKANNSIVNRNFEAYGQVTPYTDLDVVFEVQGKLLQGDKKLKAGHSFKKGSILYKVDQSEELYSIYARRSSFQSMLVNLLPDIELDFPNQLSKWKNFIGNIKDKEKLPGFPDFNSEKEKRFINSKNVSTEYYTIKSTETRLDKYVYRAPFDGTVIETFAQEGAYVAPSSRIARIVKTGDYEVKVPIKKAELSHFEKASDLWFLSPENDTVGKGKIIRTSNVVNNQTQSIDVYLSISTVNNHKIYQGDFLNLNCSEQLNETTITLPHTAVDNGMVQIIEDSTLTEVPIKTLGYKGDSLLVTGVKDNQVVLCTQRTTIDENEKFEAVVK